MLKEYLCSCRSLLTCILVYRLADKPLNSVLSRPWLLAHTGPILRLSFRRCSHSNQAKNITNYGYAIILVPLISKV